MKPSSPSQADARWKAGLSNKPDSLAPRDARSEIRVKSMKNMVERAIEIAMNTGVVAVGAVRRSGEFLGNADRSISPLIPFQGVLVHVNVP
jgi:hypothetical protein